VTNIWWVKIKAGDKQRWVSAARISGGDNDQPIRPDPTNVTGRGWATMAHPHSCPALTAGRNGRAGPG
jgi:hypothetical protein